MILHLDYRQTGLGSNSCGPGPLEEYRLVPQEMTCKLRLLGFSKDAICPTEAVKRDCR